MSVLASKHIEVVEAVFGQCEAWDWVSTADDASSVRCTRAGLRIREDCGLGHVRHRTVCPEHGGEPMYAVSGR